MNLDIFIIGGQSNAVGQGNSSQSPNVPYYAPYGGNPATGVVAWNGTSIVAGNDPFTSASTGSAWPAFGAEYYKLTGRSILFVNGAVGGSSQFSGGLSGDWDTTGTFFNALSTMLTAAWNAASTAGYAPSIKGLLWCQGEADAIRIAAGTMTIANYQTAFANMAARFRTNLGYAFPIYIFRTGTDPQASDNGYSSIRTAQDGFNAIDPYTEIVFSDSIVFPGAGMSPTVHYAQSGYNWMGKSAAIRILGGVSPPFEYSTSAGNFIKINESVFTSVRT